MLKFVRSVATVFVLGLFVAGVVGCQKKEGPAERAGKAMDKAAEKAGQEIGKVGDKLKDAAKDLKK
ncbi:MAG: hypothetical protein HXX11_04975 [Desulfuromonadales bacterium]|nr:hypothetical protein [Desulfuromonadales bacterium]